MFCYYRSEILVSSASLRIFIPSSEIIRDFNAVRVKWEFGILIEDVVALLLLFGPSALPRHISNTVTNIQVIKYVFNWSF